MVVLTGLWVTAARLGRAGGGGFQLSLGYGFVEFERKADAQKALKTLQVRALSPPPVFCRALRRRRPMLTRDARRPRPGRHPACRASRWTATRGSSSRPTARPRCPLLRRPQHKGNDARARGPAAPTSTRPPSSWCATCPLRPTPEKSASSSGARRHRDGRLALAVVSLSLTASAGPSASQLSLCARRRAAAGRLASSRACACRKSLMAATAALLLSSS